MGDTQVKHYQGIDWEQPTPFLPKKIDAMPEDVKAVAAEARKAEMEKTEKHTEDDARQGVKQELLFAPD